MSKILRVHGFAGLLLFTVVNPALSADNLERVYQQRCQGCHTVTEDGGARQGPNLWGILGREVGSVHGYEYSDDLADSKLIWTEDLLDQWLENPKAVFPHTYMMSALKNPKKRSEIIEFLSTRQPEQETTDG